MYTSVFGKMVEEGEDKPTLPEPTTMPVKRGPGRPPKHKVIKMPGKSHVKTSCGVCLQRIVNGKEEAIFCEGKCQQWYHRVCASVPRELFATLTASDAPFYCLTCSLSSLQQVAELTREICRLQDAIIPKLREENSALSREVAELCEIQNCSGRTADAVSTKTSSGKQHASWTKVVRRGNRQTVNTTGSRPQARATCTHLQRRDPQAQRQGYAQTFAVPVPDARRIWVTLKTTTIRAVEKVIGSLTKVPTSELKIKRKYKTTTDNLNSSIQRVFRWWFVVIAKESVLEQLQKEWHLVAMQTDWKLTPLLQYVKPNLQLPNQSNQSSQDHGTDAANHGSGNAGASDAQLSLFDANNLANQQHSSLDKQTSVPIVHQSSHSTLNTGQQSLIHSSVLQSSIVPDLQPQSPILTQTDEQTTTLPPAHNLSENSQTTSVNHSQTAKADITNQPLLSSSLSASSSCSSSLTSSPSLSFLGRK